MTTSTTVSDPTGSLAIIDAELRTFYGNMIVNRSWFFDAAGRETEAPRTYRDLQTTWPTDAKGTDGLGYQDHLVPEYMTTKVRDTHQDRDHHSHPSDVPLIRKANPISPKFVPMAAEVHCPLGTLR